MFTLEKARLGMEEEDNCLENSERLSCEKGSHVFSTAPKETSDIRRSRTEKMRKNFLVLNSN